jgi:hypothetical protein
MSRYRLYVDPKELGELLAKTSDQSNAGKTGKAWLSLEFSVFC